MKNNKSSHKFRNVVVKASKLIIIFLLPIVVLLSIVEIHAFDNEFYNEQFKENQVSNITKINNEDLVMITETMIDYLKDKRDSLDMQVQINGQVEEGFGEREKMHMDDVKNLFQKGFLVRNYGLLLVIVSGAILFTLDDRKLLYRSLFNSSILAITFMIMLFVLVKLDFMKYFTYFHKIFFDNDLWLLNPKTDVLIQMVPLEFFINISTRIATWFISSMILLFSITLFAININKKRIEKG